MHHVQSYMEYMVNDKQIIHDVTCILVCLICFYIITLFRSSTITLSGFVLLNLYYVFTCLDLKFFSLKRKIFMELGSGN